MVRKLLLVCAVSSLMLGAAACNTVKGLGRDIQSVGEAGDRAVR
ncbi:MAG: entericidin A/B family lipoprotein [Novosphingobium sp.]